MMSCHLRKTTKFSKLHSLRPPPLTAAQGLKNQPPAGLRTYLGPPVEVGWNRWLFWKSTRCYDKFFSLTSASRRARGFGAHREELKRASERRAGLPGPTITWNKWFPSDAAELQPGSHRRHHWNVQLTGIQASSDL